jgi:thioredoxin 2
MQLRCPHCNKPNRLDEARLGEQPVCGACGKPLLLGVQAVDAEALNELIAQSHLPVLVDFWAFWCAPCRSFAPTFANAANKHGESILFTKIDTEAHQAAAAQHNIRSLPTLAVFYQGKEIGRVSGALPAAQLDELVNQVLAQTTHA